MLRKTLLITSRHIQTARARSYAVGVPAFPTFPVFSVAGLTRWSTPIFTPSLQQAILKISSTITGSLFSGILFLKRTLQPSIIKKRRVHGYLARLADKDGRRVLNRRRQKRRTRLV
ncbi:50S ribosomal protein L34 [archaeon]|nr:MAG: 50S ribosomal protein L34 [archaeon]